MKKGRKRPEEKADTSESCITLRLSLFCLLIVIIHFIASFFPKGRIWGINQWAYFPLMVTLPVTFLVLVFLVPSFNRLALNTTKTLMSPLFRWAEKKRHIWYLIFSLLFMILFWILRTKTHFLGDGYQILSKVESGELAFKWTEPLESFIHLKAFHLAKRFFNLDAETLYAILSCVAGGIFIYLSFLFANFLGKEKSQLIIRSKAGGILVFLILVSMGSIQLFFGYVEHYTFLFLSVFCFLFISIAYLEGKTKWIFPLLISVLAFSFHLSALCLLPPLLFLFYEKSNFHRGKGLLLGAFALILVVIMFLGYKRYSWSLPPLFVPLIHDRYSAPGYTLFSLPHLLDFLNQQFLVSPVGLILILVFLFCKKGRISFWNPTSRFLLIVALSQLLLNFIIDPGLGASRDWDMFSAVGLGYTILGLYLLLRFIKDKMRLEYLTMILVITSLYSTVPWIALNSSEPNSTQRFRNLLLIDPRKSPNGHFVLVKYFKTHGQEEEIEKQNQVQRELLPELPLIVDGKKLLVNGELDSAEAKFRQAKEIAPRFSEAHHNMGMVYLAKRSLDKAEMEFKEAIELAPFAPGAYVSLGNLYAVKGDTNSALDSYEKAIFLKWPDPEPYYNVGLIYFRKGDMDKAEDFFKKTLRLKSDFEDAYLGLGNVYKEENKFQKATEMYQTAIRLKPDLAIAHLQLGMTYLYLHSNEEAIKELERYLELDPQSKSAEEVRNILQELRSFPPKL
jgi:tetratricopeptide (TPR) repeat protein